MNSSRRAALVQTWYEATLRSYFPTADAAFLGHASFAHPVGQNFHQAMTAIIDGLADGLAREAFAAPLDRIIRILAVQELPAGMSVRFLALLRRQLLAEAALSPAEKSALADRIDDLTETAVEIWLECRETLYTLRINELRKRIQLLEAGSTAKD